MCHSVKMKYRDEVCSTELTLYTADVARQHRLVIKLLRAIAWDTVKTRKRRKTDSNGFEYRKGAAISANRIQSERSTVGNKAKERSSRHQKGNMEGNLQSYTTRRASLELRVTRKVTRRSERSTKKYSTHCNTFHSERTKVYKHIISKRATQESRKKQQAQLHHNTITMVYEIFRRDNTGQRYPNVDPARVVGQNGLQEGGSAPKLYVRKGRDEPYWKFYFSDKYWRVTWHCIMNILSEYDKILKRAIRYNERGRSYEFSNYAILIELVAKAMGPQYIPEGIQQLHRDLCAYTRQNAFIPSHQHQDFDWEEAQRRRQEPMNDNPWTEPKFYVMFYQRTARVDVHNDDRWELHLAEHERRRNPLFAPLMAHLNRAEQGETDLIPTIEDEFADLIANHGLTHP